MTRLGMAEASIFGARQLLDAPLDPQQNSDGGYSTHSQGIASFYLGGECLHCMNS